MLYNRNNVDQPPSHRAVRYKGSGQTHSTNGSTPAASWFPHVVAACKGRTHLTLAGPPSQLRLPAKSIPAPGIQSQDGPEAPSGRKLVMVAVGKGGSLEGVLVRVMTLVTPFVLQYCGEVEREVPAVAHIRSLYS